MSTKIYNGLIFKNQTLNDVYQGLMSIKPTVIAHAQRNVLTSMCEASVNIMDTAATANAQTVEFKADDYTQGKGQWDRSDWCLHWHRQFREAQKTDTREYMDIDFVFEIALFPYKEHVLAYWIAESDSHEILDALSSIGATDYHYQNSTDKPDNITEQEWEERSQAWCQVLPTAPIDTGLIFSLVTWHDLRITVYDLFKNPELWPSEEKRKKAIAKEIAIFQVDHSPEYKDLSIFDKLEKSKELYTSLIESVVLFDVSVFNKEIDHD